MKAVRSIVITGILGLIAAGCGENTTSPGGDLSIEGRRNNGGGAPGGGDCDGLPVAPESERVDLYAPVFSNPTNVTNPLFPIRELDRVVLLGTVDGEPLRVETTLLSGTRVITVDGEEIETLVSQYVAWIDGKIEEVALDWYAQDDRGAVWYLGEDVFNYEDGEIADIDGTWLAGRDGPVAMIMPASPMVGDVWRPENICDFVFEEVTAVATGVTVVGPGGPVAGALEVSELHMDGTYEDKTFAPGYGEFSTGSAGNLEAVALAVPTDALDGPVPNDVEILADGAESTFQLAKAGRWSRVATEAAKMKDAWKAYQSTGVPPMLEAQMDEALDELDAAINTKSKGDVRQASVHVSLAAVDFELRYEDRQEIDRDLLEIWTRQRLVDQEAGDHGAVLGDLATIRWIRNRLGPSSHTP